MHYVIGDIEKTILNKFFFNFYARWFKGDQNDFDIVVFSNNRQQSQNNLQERDIILRQIFFEFLTKQNVSLTLLDSKRLFNEAEKIKIYRNDNGLCQQCLAEGKSEKEAQVSWTQYQADHIFPHSKGGKTITDNGQVLCVYHNVRKSATVPTK
ncbi:MAG: HNH endonuclease [Bacteroidota bacterium]